MDFFFEKKKQKTFVHFPPGGVKRSRVKSCKSFWGAFFQKGAFFLKLESAPVASLSSPSFDNDFSPDEFFVMIDSNFN
jgi:hypothetical protein